MKTLFITRKYPPQIGGMERYSYELIKNFPAGKRVFFLGKKQWNLLWWLPYVFFRVIFSREKFNAIYLCDGLLAPLGWLLKIAKRLPIAITCHGLDVTYPHFLYQTIVILALKKLDKIICVSRATLEKCAMRGISREKLVFIPNGVSTELKTQNSKLKTTTQNLKLSNLNINLQNKHVLLTVGRLVKRKGVAWFVEKVMLQLPKNIIYFIVGVGHEYKNIETTVAKYRLENQVFLLGRLSDAQLDEVYQLADIFVMPNISVSGDIEGFGLVALEAVMHNLPVIASNLEGIRDAIYDQKNGVLVPTKNAQEFIRQINIYLKDQEKKQALIERAWQFTSDNFNWEKIANQYLHEIQNVIK